MQALRNAVSLTRFVLVWFALSICAAVAAPVVKPQSLELVCSAGGAMKMVEAGADGQSGDAAALECPLCLAADAPPPRDVSRHAAAQPLGHVLQSIPAARIAALTAAPLPARGPPAFEAH